MNKRQRKSLIKLFWDLSIICIAIAVIGNLVKPDVALAKTLVLVGCAVVFAIIGFIMGNRE